MLDHALLMKATRLTSSCTIHATTCVSLQGIKVMDGETLSVIAPMVLVEVCPSLPFSACARVRACVLPAKGHSSMQFPWSL